MSPKEQIQVGVQSEIGKLECVITHTPSREIENMTPEDAGQALYSDILNLHVVQNDYSQFLGVLKKFAKVLEVKELMSEVLKNEEVKNELLSKICRQETTDDVCQRLYELSHEELIRQLIEGVEMRKDTVTNFLSHEHFTLHPLPNFFFTRDASFTMNESVMISQMAKKVRERESWIMEAIFRHHPLFNTKVVNPVRQYDRSGKGSIEGGDVLIIRHDIFMSGISSRTTSQGADAILEYLKTLPGTKHLILQELPTKPESFIHLDMTFTMLDRDTCMVFEPLIFRSSRHITIHVEIDGDKVVKIREEKNILEALKKLGLNLEPVYCGGDTDTVIMEREQWQSGANFFALAPGKIIGYGRNTHTIEALSKKGYAVVKAKDLLKNKVDLTHTEKFVVTIEGAELSRGGGGARCMTMPVRRAAVDW